MTTWQALVRRELRRYHEQTNCPVLTRQEFLDQARPAFEKAYPNNNTPGQKFSQIMQQLESLGEVSFVDYAGTYRIVDLNEDDIADDDGTEPSYQTSQYQQPSYRGTEYETTTTTRSMPTAFRTETLGHYRNTGVLSGVDVPALLDVAHILPWSEYEDEQLNPGNVMLLSKTHHAAFDADLFTLDRNLRLWTAPDFDTESDLLRQTLLDREGTRISWPETAPDVSARLADRNRTLDWDVPA
ncbi:HNH endonuclease [Haloarchaeobius sp. DYHT-AS-18]|uniref:HNH endonuclease n=1 Tax=Haloarchaeobius sp. DYHT-AS-18 TaxID=3446117 RepID=UPI003EB8059E